MKNESIQRRGFMFVLSSPSGAGKTTLARALIVANSNLVMSVSATTRQRRKEEIDGVDYFFVTKDIFSEMRDGQEFLEHAHVFEHYYGTPRQMVEKELNAGRDVLFDIDWQGTDQLSASKQHDLVSVFILPPSIAELEQRLKNRAQDAHEVLAKRMAQAHNEISHYNSYDYVLVNHDISDSLKKLSSILQAERLKRLRQTGLEGFVHDLMKD